MLQCSNYNSSSPHLPSIPVQLIPPRKTVKPDQSSRTPMTRTWTVSRWSSAASFGCNPDNTTCPAVPSRCPRTQSGTTRYDIPHHRTQSSLPRTAAGSNNTDQRRPFHLFAALVESAVVVSLYSVSRYSRRPACYCATHCSSAAAS